MSKSSHFSGQPLYGKVIKLLDKSKVLDFSRKYGGERYVKRFDYWTHLIVILYAVIQHFDSLREITTSPLAEVPSDIKFTSATTNDSFMLKPSALSKGNIIAMNCAF